jgi:hypothetical protein
LVIDILDTSIVGIAVELDQNLALVPSDIGVYATGTFGKVCKIGNTIA